METIAVIFGGRSAEHDVSIVTALASVIKPLELTKKYKVEPIYIAKTGNWYSDEKLKDITLFTSGKIDTYIKKTHPVAVQFDSGMKLLKNTSLMGRKQVINIDIVFPAMHGTYGEDGALMGMLDMAGVPYVGCGLAASVVAMDKALSKQIATANNIPVSSFTILTRSEINNSLDEAVHHVSTILRYPLFVKPAHLGSSIGISKVQNENELRNGLEVAGHYDNKIVVEEAVQNLIEVTLPIIGNSDPQPALLERPLTQAEDFFDFETKYMQGRKRGKSMSGHKGTQGYSEIPAGLPKELEEQAITTGLAVYKALGCSGIARIDMLIDQKASQVYFNEVNPLPGGLYAHNWNHAGISNMELVSRLVTYAKERYKNQQDLTTTFSTNYLKQF